MPSKTVPTLTPGQQMAAIRWEKYSSAAERRKQTSKMREAAYAAYQALSPAAKRAKMQALVDARKPPKPPRKNKSSVRKVNGGKGL